MIRSRDCDPKRALLFYPFHGDETDVRPFSDKLVRAATMHPRCHICENNIQAGEVHRALTERNNENKTVVTFRFCSKCIRAMAHPDCYNRGRLIDSRYRIGAHRRKELP